MSNTDTQNTITTLASTLRNGAGSDIFYDANASGDEGAAAQIIEVTDAMERSANLLERFGDLLEELRNTIDVDGDLKTMDMTKLLRAADAIDEISSEASKAPAMC